MDNYHFFLQVDGIRTETRKGLCPKGLSGTPWIPYNLLDLFEVDGHKNQQQQMECCDEFKVPSKDRFAERRGD